MHLLMSALFALAGPAPAGLVEPAPPPEVLVAADDDKNVRKVPIKKTPAPLPTLPPSVIREPPSSPPPTSPPHQGPKVPQGPDTTQCAHGTGQRGWDGCK